MEKKVRAVIYCRVSTSSDSQVESLDKQVEEAVSAVKKLGFELTDRFIDEGKTGTTKEARKEYLRMISEIDNDQFDVIVTKSLDRMNRNILDFYLLLDLVIKNDIRLYFYLDRNYYMPDDKLVIGIKAILAEEYSRELSKKLCSAHAKRQERGEVIMLSKLTYGYKKEIQPDGKKTVVIVEEEAEMIRLIFDLCKQGYGSRAIGKLLYARGYRNRNGNEITETTIRRIIRNPLVMGTMVMNKVKYDFNTKTTVYTDSSQWIWKEEAVPEIVTEADWKLANQRMDSRRSNKNGEVPTQRHGQNQGKFNFSGKLICGLCGRPYYKTQRTTKHGKVVEWKCSTYLKFGRLDNGCANLAVREDELIEILQETAWKAFPEEESKQSLIRDTLTLLEKILNNKEEAGRERILQKKYETVSNRKETLLVKYLDGKIPDAAYDQMNQKLEKELNETEEELTALKANHNAAAQIEERLMRIEHALEVGGIEKATAYTIMEMIEQIAVYPNYIEINLLNGQGQSAVRISTEDRHKKQNTMAIERSKEQIYQLLEENPAIRIKELADRLGLGKRTVFARIRILKEEGRVDVAGHGKGSRWKL